MLTQERLREVLDYDPDTGQFKWKSKCWRHRGRELAGCLDNKGYRIIAIDRRPYKAHRLAWLYMTVDPSDNCWTNIRQASRSQNNANRRTSSLNKLGVKGVSRCRKTGKFVAAAKLDGKRRYLGTFASLDEAQAAYLRAANTLHGEFARTG